MIYFILCYSTRFVLFPHKCFFCYCRHIFVAAVVVIVAAKLLMQCSFFSIFLMRMK